jgi:integrase/recombinase XerD
MPEETAAERLYHPQHRLEVAIKHLQETDGLQENKRAALAFIESSRQRCRGLRLTKLAGLAAVVVRNSDKPFKEMARSDVESVLNSVFSGIRGRVGGVASQNTERDYRIFTRLLFRHVHGLEDGENPPATRWIKIKRVPNGLTPHDLLFVEEIGRLVQAVPNLRDKTLISTLAETGIRAGELLTLCLRDVQQDQLGFTLHVTGKTGSRVVRIVTSTGLLAQFLNEHPRRDDPDAPLFYSHVGNQSGRQFGPTSYSNLRKLLATAFKRAGVPKSKCRAHLFRHSAASRTADKFTRSIQCKYYGWSASSTTPAIYEHIAPEAVDRAVLAMHGKADAVKGAPGYDAPACERCKQENTPGAMFCRACGWKIGTNATQIPPDGDVLAVLHALAAFPNLKASLDALPSDALRGLKKQLDAAEKRGGLYPLKPQAPGGRRSKAPKARRKRADARL